MAKGCEDLVKRGIDLMLVYEWRQCCKITYTKQTSLPVMEIGVRGLADFALDIS